MGISFSLYLATPASAAFDHGSFDEGLNAFFALHNASISISSVPNNQWLPGVPLTVEVNDPDVNRDSQSVETLLLSTAYDNILAPSPYPEGDPYDTTFWLQKGSVPYLKIGDPQMIGSGWAVMGCAEEELCGILSGVPVHVYNESSEDEYCQWNPLFTSGNCDYSIFLDSGVAIVNTHLTDDITINNGDSLIIDNAYGGSSNFVLSNEAPDTVFRFLNYDLSSLNDKLAAGKINTVSIMIESVNLATVSELKGYLQIPQSTIDEIPQVGGYMTPKSLKIVFDDVDAGTKYSPKKEMAIAVDIFAFGYWPDDYMDTSSGYSPGPGIMNDAIYRLEAVETGPDTSTFAGTIEFVRLTDNSIDDVSFLSDLRTFGNSIKFAIGPVSYGTMAPKMQYVDLDFLNLFTITAAQQDAYFQAVMSDISVTTDEDTTVVIPIESPDFVGINESWRILNFAGTGPLENISDFELVYTPPTNFVGTISAEIDLPEKYIQQQINTFPFTLTITVNPVDDPPIVTGLDDILGTGGSGGWSDLWHGEHRLICVGDPASQTPHDNVECISSAGLLTKSSEGQRWYDDFLYNDVEFIPINDIADKSYLFETIDYPLSFIAYVTEDTPTQLLLTGFDPDGDTLSFEIVSQPTHGTLTEGTPYSSEGHEHSHPSGYQFASYLYTPDSDYAGYTNSAEDVWSDSFTYKVNDGTSDSEFLPIGFPSSQAGFKFAPQFIAYPAIETIKIMITPVNDIPVAEAGSDQSVDVGSVVQLDGSQSSDADGDTVTYSWIQTSGYPVTLTADNIANPQFTAPSTGGQLTFMLSVNDGVATSSPNIINIYVGEAVPEPTAAPPPGSVASSPSNSQVSLSWSTPSDDGGAAITDYLVEYSTDGVVWLGYDDGTSTATSATITGLLNGQEYQFRISTVNSVGVGDPTPLLTATPFAIPEEIPVVEEVPEEIPVVEEVPEEIPVVEEVPEEIPVVEPVAEPVQETISEPQAAEQAVNEPLPFYNPDRGIEHYVERYTTEPEYRAWFERNYPGYTIYEGIGITESEYQKIVNDLTKPQPVAEQKVVVQTSSGGNEIIYVLVAAVAVGGGIGAIFFMKKGSKPSATVRRESPSRRQKTVLFCGKCGSSLISGARFCGKCGNSQS